MEVSDELSADAERSARSYGSPVLRVRIESSDAVSLVAAAANSAVASLNAPPAYWSVAVEDEVVAVHQWGYVPEIAPALRRLADELARRGVSGRLVQHSAWTAPHESTLREREAGLLECHLRCQGERRRDEATGYVAYFPAEKAVLTSLEIGLRWIADPPPGARLFTNSGGPHRDIAEVRAAIARRFAVEAEASRRGRAGRGELDPTGDGFAARIGDGAWWESDEAFRVMSFSTGQGDLSLAEGGIHLDAQWARVYKALLDELHRASGWAAYGFIKRGRSPASVGRSLGHDWLPAFHYGMYDLGHSRYEDVLAPDAFGAQLLGAGYAGRLPDGDDWERSDLGDRATLVVHRDRAAWFAEPLPSITSEDSMLRNPSYPVPEVVVRARDQFAPILLTWEVNKQSPLDPLAS